MSLMLARAASLRPPEPRTVFQFSVDGDALQDCLSKMSDTELGAQRRRQLAAARLYLVCDSAPVSNSLPELLRGAIAGGVDVVQLREKHLADDQLIEVAQQTAALCKELGTLMIVNDRPDIAIRAGADGVHIGQEDMPVADARALVGPDLLIGLSTHSPGDIDRAQGNGDGAPVDYIGVGPVYATPTKPGRGAVGTELVRYAAAHAHIPFFAIGGLDEHNLGEPINAGARRICVLRAIAAATDPYRAARTLRQRIERHS